MKKIFTIISACLLSSFTFAQAPNLISFQSVVRNNSFSLVTNTTVGIQTSILQGSASGTPVYVENQTATTNANGLASFAIGAGTPTTGTMSGIDWSAGPYFVKTEIDPAGGNNYTISSTSQLLSVPYALNSGNGNWTKTGNNISNSNSGKVGIGTTTPNAKLEVAGGIQATGHGSNSTQGAYLEWNRSNGDGKTWLLNQKGLGVGGFIIGDVVGNDINNHMLIDSSGNTTISTLGREPSIPGPVSIASSGDLLFNNVGPGAMAMGFAQNSFSGWIQCGASGTTPVNLALEPMGGKVGIGPVIPLCPLDVSGSGNMNTSNGYLLNAFGTASYSGSSLDISIRAQYAVSSINFLAQSDSRIKHIIGRSDSKNDLSLLNSINVTDYTFKDYIGYGKDVQKKVIAQELEKVLPSAVGKTSNYIPDVYAIACDVKSETGTLMISLDKSHGLKQGDKIKWMDNTGKEQFTEVCNIVSDNDFEIDYSGTVTKAFIYGKLVNDFRVVDYDAITMLNVSATQELYKMMIDMKAENEKLKAENENMKAENASFKSDIGKIKAQLGMDVKAEK